MIRWKVILDQQTCDNSFNPSYFPHKFEYKFEALELIKRIKERGGSAHLEPI